MMIKMFNKNKKNTSSNDDDKNSNSNIIVINENEAASLKHAIALLNRNLRELISLLKDKKVKQREGFLK